MDYIAEHKKIYDSLANEYESRNETLLGVTKEAVGIIKKYLNDKDSILELGCGSGLSAKLLQDSGFQVSAIELSSKMIEKAARLAPEVVFIEGDFLKVSFPTKFKAIFALAFIHLFPKEDALKVLRKAHSLLENSGILYIGTTKELKSFEGWQKKNDYKSQLHRYRKHWTQQEFEQALREVGFEIVELKLIEDPFGKVWMDFIAKKI